MLRRFARAISVAACLIGLPALAGPQARLDARVTLDLPAHVGGLSGLEVNADGSRAVLLSDRGWLFHVDILRDADGRATGMKRKGDQRLRHDGEHRHPDSEGLAQASENEFFVSTEGPTRVLQYRWGKKFPDYLPDIPTARDLDTNRGLEALAIRAGGALFTLFETPDGPDGYTLFRFADGAWSEAGSLPEAGTFSVVGADFDDIGRLYILERAFSPLGFRTRIRRADLDVIPIAPETLFQSSLGTFDNLEGIAVSRTATGATRITLISDDNFTHILRAELVELLLEE
jgi:hypothetical protein